jgi:hypothetical protein
MSEHSESWQNRPGVWFGILYRALENLDFKGAAEAQENLNRLGVEVRFRQWPGTNPGGPRERKAVPQCQ